MGEGSMTRVLFQVTLHETDREGRVHFGSEAGAEASTKHVIPRARAKAIISVPKGSKVDVAPYAARLMGDRRSQAILMVERSCNFTEGATGEGQPVPSPQERCYNLWVLEAPRISRDLRVGATYAVGGLAAASRSMEDVGTHLGFVLYVDFEGQK